MSVQPQWERLPTLLITQVQQVDCLQRIPTTTVWKRSLATVYSPLVLNIPNLQMPMEIQSSFHGQLQLQLMRLGTRLIFLATDFSVLTIRPTLKACTLSFQVKMPRTRLSLHSLILDYQSHLVHLIPLQPGVLSRFQVLMPLKMVSHSRVYKQLEPPLR